MPVMGNKPNGKSQFTNEATLSEIHLSNRDWLDIHGYNPEDQVELLYPGEVTPATWDKAG